MWISVRTNKLTKEERAECVKIEGKQTKGSQVYPDKLCYSSWTGIQTLAKATNKDSATGDAVGN